MVCNLHFPTGTTYFRFFFRIWNIRAMLYFNMYKQAKSYVQFHKSQSEVFSCLAGVRQGEHLSPILFAIYLADLEAFLKNKYKGLPFLKEKIVQDGQIDLF